MAMIPERLICAVPTPFGADGALDLQALTNLLVELEAEVDAVLMAGTTGEFPALDDHERLTTFTAALEIFGAGRVIAHVGAASLLQVHRLAVAAAELGLRRFALLTPYYLPVDDASVVDWFQSSAQIMKNCTLYPYLFPERTGVTVSPTVVGEILAIPCVQGLKVSGTASATIHAWADVLRPGQQLWSGNDADLPGVLAAGGHGVISGVSAAFPRLFGHLRRTVRDGGCLDTAQSRVVAAVAAASSVPLLHEALRIRTGHVWACRMPGQVVTKSNTNAIEALLTCDWG